MIFHYVYIYTPDFLTHSSVPRHLAVVNNALMNIDISVWVPAFSSFGHMHRGGITRSYGKSISNSLRNSHTIFHYGYTSLCSHHKNSYVSTFSPTHVLFIVAILVGGNLYPIVDLCFLSDSHFFSDQWCWMSFPVLVCPLCIFFGDISVQVLCPFLNWVIWLFVFEL